MVKTKTRDIFEELDEKTAPHSACTCGTMFALLVILLVVSVIGSLYTITLIMTRVNGPKISLTDVSGKDVLAKLQSFVKKPPKDTGFELVVTEKELTVLLQEAAAENDALPIKGLQAAITPEAIIIAGTVTKPLTSDISIWLVPKMVDHKLEFDIVKLSAGKITLPQVIIDLFEQRIAALIRSNLKDLQDIPVNEVKLQSGSMVIK